MNSKEDLMKEINYLKIRYKNAIEKSINSESQDVRQHYEKEAGECVCLLFMLALERGG